VNLLDGADQTPNEHDEIYNKWKTKFPDAPPELLEVKTQSDLYVKTLERQKDDLRKDYLSQRDELLAKAKFEEYFDRMKSTLPQDLQVALPPAKEVESLKIDPSEVKNIFKQEYQQVKLAEKETENFAKVESKLKERYGNNVAAVLREQQNTLGLSDDEINNLAKRSPEAFFRVMGLNQAQGDTFQSPPRSNQRNDNFAPRGAPKRDYQYYQELKKNNPKIYLDPKIQVQMHNDAVALGDAFGMPA
jgi:hypothetical protein